MSVEYIPRIPKHEPVAYVYAIFCIEGDSGFLKVGYSTDPFKRVSGIAGGSPFTPERIGVVKAGSRNSAYNFEQRLHGTLQRRRVAQEWFKYDLRDAAQKAEFDKYSQVGFGSGWQTFPFDAMKEMLRRSSLAAFHSSQKTKRTRSNPYDRRWMEGTKGAGKPHSIEDGSRAAERYANCKLSSLK